MFKSLLKSEKLIFWGVIFLLVFIPLYPKFPLMTVKGTFVAVRIEDLLILLIISFWLVQVFYLKRFKELLSEKIVQAVLLFFLVGAVSLFSGIFLTHTVVPHLGLLHYFRRIEYMMLLPLALSAFQSRKQLRTVLWIMAVVVLVVNFYALGQKYLDWPVISTGNSEFSKGQILRLTSDARVNSTFAGHYDLAVFLVIVLVVLSALFFTFKKIQTQILALFIMALSMLVLIMTAARLSFVAVVGGIALSLLLSGKKMMLILLVFLTILILAYPSQLQERLISTLTVSIQGRGERFNPQDKDLIERSRLNIPTLPIDDLADNISSKAATISGRVYSDIALGEPSDVTQLGVYRSLKIRLDQEWPRAIRAFIKNPLLGTGYSSLGLATDNDFLRMLGEVGLLGLTSFILIIIELTKKVWENYLLKDKQIKLFS